MLRPPGVIEQRKIVGVNRFSFSTTVLSAGRREGGKGRGARHADPQRTAVLILRRVFFMGSGTAVVREQFLCATYGPGF